MIPVLIPAREKGVCEITYRVAICDDDGESVRTLTEQVSEILKSKGVCFEISAFSSGEELLAYIDGEAASFHLYLLDIFMKEINGVDTARAIRRTSESAAIIFTTASERYVFSGYEVQALQYLMKPVSLQALSAALTVDLKRLYENRYFVFKTGGMTQKVLYDDVEYLESTLKSVKLVAKQGAYEIYDQISSVENVLPRVSFCRCHRGFIINFRQVSKMNARFITTVSGNEIPIGKTYAAAVSSAFLNFIGGAGE